MNFERESLLYELFSTKTVGCTLLLLIDTDARAVAEGIPLVSGITAQQSALLNVRNGRVNHVLEECLGVAKLLLPLMITALLLVFIALGKRVRRAVRGFHRLNW